MAMGTGSNRQLSFTGSNTVSPTRPEIIASRRVHAIVIGFGESVLAVDNVVEFVPLDIGNLQ